MNLESLVLEMREDLREFRTEFLEHDKEDREERAAIVVALAELRGRLTMVGAGVGAVLTFVQAYFGWSS